MADNRQVSGRFAMRVKIKILRWVFLVLYIAIIVGLFGTIFHKSLSDEDPLWPSILLLSVAVVSQVLFIFGAGTINLCKPIRHRKLLIPVMVASLVMTVLVAGMLLAFIELAEGDVNEYLFWGFIGLNWIVWSIIFFIRQRRTERYKVIRNLIATLFASSLIELMVSIPSHIIVSRRPGCLVGIGTATGIACGIGVMLWAFGPGIILLFLKERRENELYG